MSFIHSDSERSSLGHAARRAIEIHGEPDYALNPEDRKMREQEHTGIELTGPELAYLKHHIAQDVEDVEGKIVTLEESLGQGREPNSSNAEAELVTLRKQLDFLKHNLVEKLFGETKR